MFEVGVEVEERELRSSDEVGEEEGRCKDRPGRCSGSPPTNSAIVALAGIQEWFSAQWTGSRLALIAHWPGL